MSEETKVTPVLPEDSPGQESVNTPSETPAPETKGQAGETPKSDATKTAAAPDAKGQAETPWYVKRGFVSEEAANTSWDSLRAEFTKTRMDNAKLQAEMKALQEIANGTVSVDDRDAYISDAKESAAKKVLDEQNNIETMRSQFLEAVEWGEETHPQIVTPVNYKTLGILAQGAPAECKTMIARLKHAIKEFKELRGLDEKTQEAIEAKKKEMKAGVNPPSPGKKLPEAEFNAWDMKPEDFNKMKEKVTSGMV